MEKQLLSYNLHIQRNFKNPICRLNVAVYKFAYYEILPNAVYSHIHYQIYDLSNIFYKKL